MKNKPGEKKTLILNHLKNGRTITPKQAWTLYGHMRLASCVHRLISEGYDIKKVMRYGLFKRDQWAEYYIPQPK